MSIGSRIKERREELGITQVELAALLGVSKGAIGNYETDANSPKASVLYKLFRIFNCDANYLYQDEICDQECGAESAMERRLIVLFNKLNDEGKEKLIDSADDLVRSGKYIKNDKAGMVDAQT